VIPDGEAEGYPGNFSALPPGGAKALGGQTGPTLRTGPPNDG
jgi:hypothetical protein